MTKLEKAFRIQIAYVVYAVVTIWILIDWPFAHSSANDRVHGRLLSDFILIIWSLYMFGTGIVDLVREMRSKKIPDTRIHRVAAIRMILAVLFGVSAQWFLVQAVMEYLN